LLALWYNYSLFLLSFICWCIRVVVSQCLST